MVELFGNRYGFTSLSSVHRLKGQKTCFQRCRNSTIRAQAERSMMAEKSHKYSSDYRQPARKCIKLLRERANTFNYQLQLSIPAQTTYISKYYIHTFTHTHLFQRNQSTNQPLNNSQVSSSPYSSTATNTHQATGL